MKAFRRLAIGVFALAFGIIGSESRAADFEILQNNPVRDGCLFSNSIAPDGYLGWDRWRYQFGECVPGSGEARADGTGTPEALRQYADQSRLFFYAENSPALARGNSDDPDFDYKDTHGLAVLASHYHGRVIRITGPIEAGDTERLRAFLDQNDLIHCYEPGYCPFQNVLSLDSPGGNLAEGLRLAQFVRETQFNTLIEAGRECESSCSFAFLAGYSNYEGYYHPRRFIHETGRLGVHRPTLALPDRSFTPQEVEAFFDLFDFVKSEAVRQFVDARFPMRALGQMYATPPEEMFAVPIAQASRFATVFETPLVSKTRLKRAGLLSLCAEEFAKDRGYVHPDLLKNLRSNDDTFLTHVENDSFACYGARGPDDRWYFDMCFGSWDFECLLLKCIVEDDSRCFAKDPDGVMNFQDIAYGLPMGHALSYARFNRKAMILNAFQDDFESEYFLGSLPDRVRQIGSWLPGSQPPREFCGAVDYRSLENASLLQALLNASGFDAGPVDGKPGARTFNAVAQANRDLLQVPEADQWTVTDALMQALGASDAQVAAMKYCS